MSHDTPADISRMEQCYACNVSLQPTYHEGQLMLSCAGCAGVFIAHSTLVTVATQQLEPRSAEERLQAQKAATGRMPAEEAAAAKRQCPLCASPMQRYVYQFSSGIVVDGCSSHGIWLDAGELQRIEAWSEATQHGAEHHSDSAVASSATPPIESHGDEKPGGRRAVEAIATVGLATGQVGMLEVAALTPIAKALINGKNHRAEASATMSMARAAAEANRIPDESTGAMVIRAEQQLPRPSELVWPHMVRLEMLTHWLSGLEEAVLVSGRGSQRVHQLLFVHGHRVEQRVTELHAGESITWRDSREWLREFEVPAWHDGCWTKLSVQPLEAEQCVARIQIAYQTTSDEHRARVTERVPGLSAWMDASLAHLAQATMRRAA